MTNMLDHIHEIQTIPASNDFISFQYDVFEGGTYVVTPPPIGYPVMIIFLGTTPLLLIFPTAAPRASYVACRIPSHMSR